MYIINVFSIYSTRILKSIVKDIMFYTIVYFNCCANARKKSIRQFNKNNTTTTYHLKLEGKDDQNNR